MVPVSMSTTLTNPSDVVYVDVSRRVPSADHTTGRLLIRVTRRGALPSGCIVHSS
jgi:hypothetical protein